MSSKISHTCECSISWAIESNGNGKALLSGLIEAMTVLVEMHECGFADLTRPPSDQSPTPTKESPSAVRLVRSSPTHKWHVASFQEAGLERSAECENPISPSGEDRWVAASDSPPINVCSTCIAEGYWRGARLRIVKAHGCGDQCGGPGCLRCNWPRNSDAPAEGGGIEGEDSPF